MATEPNKTDIVERLRKRGGSRSMNMNAGVAEILEAATEIENLRALLDQAGVTIAAAMLNGLPALPWDSEMSGRADNAGAFHLYLRDATGRKIAAIWGKGEQKKLVAETILALVNQPAPRATNIKAIEGASDGRRTAGG